MKCVWFRLTRVVREAQCWAYRVVTVIAMLGFMLYRWSEYATQAISAV